jgi:hypothetical protein
MVPKFGDRPMVMILQGAIAIAACNATDRTINSITKL